MSDTKLDGFKNRWNDATELAIEEHLSFAETPIPRQKPDESDTQYIKRMNSLSSAKTKSLKETKDLMDAMEDRSNIKKEDEQGTANKEESSSKSATGEAKADFPSPESLAS